MILMKESDRVRFAVREGRYGGAEGITRIAQTVGEYSTVTLIRFDGYDAVGDSYAVVHEYPQVNDPAEYLTWITYESRDAAAVVFAESAEISGL